MVRVFQRSRWAVLGLAAALAGCSAGTIADRLPGEMGLPADAPARPEAPYDFPAVHDMPPDRALATMSEDEQVRVENELARVRDRQEGRPQPGKKAAPAPKKLPKDAENGQTAGAKANP
jgi:hypothetical protein